MAIDIQKVVSTDFSVYRENVPLSSYGNTVVINVCDQDKTNKSGINQEVNTYNSYDDYAESEFISESDFNYDKYDAYMYFTLGGKKLTMLNIYVKNVPSTDLYKDILDALMDYKKSVSDTDDDFICVCASNTLAYSVFEQLVQEIEVLKAPYKMLLLRSVKTSVSEPKETDLQVYSDTQEQLLKSNSVIYKYYTAAKTYSCNAALTIAAYLSKVNLTNASTLRDYCYTDESSVVGTSYDNTLTETGISDKEFDTYKNTANFIDKIGNKIVNFGGNTSAGTSIIAEFGAICIENAIIHAVLDIMMQKQYLTNAGLNNVVSKIHSVMSDYITNGFLQPNTTYTGSTRYYNYGDATYKVISAGDELVDGYVIVTIPMSKLTIADRQARKFTPIYIYMQTLGGARTVEITGDILD